MLKKIQGVIGKRIERLLNKFNDNTKIIIGTLKDFKNVYISMDFRNA